MPRAGLDSEAVVSAAAELSDVEGLEAVTLTRLAERLGIRAPSLYAHIGGLADLRRQLGARGARELAAALAEAAAGRSRLDALSAIATTYRAYARDHPGTYAAMQRASENDGEAADAARDLVAIVVAAISGYPVAGEEAIHAVRIIRASLHGFVTLERERGFGMPLSLEETFTRLVGVLDRGLSGPALDRA
jgi:AcrR family transcriptional regulator